MIPIPRLVAAGLLSLSSPTDPAWIDGGHMGSASIAYDVLKQGDPATLARVRAGLRWPFHLVGDVHQPLHRVAPFTPDYPQGNHGKLHDAA